MNRSRYHQLRRLAMGGMGEVILARQVAEGGVERLVALKCIRSELSRNPRFQELFRNELRLATRLSHPNIVHVYDFGVEPDDSFLVLEYVPGDTLSKVLSRARESKLNLPIDATLAIVLDLAKGLHYAHELRDVEGAPLQIVHRDIAPENVMVSYEGVAKILDFGIANARITDPNLDDGSIMGHVNYMAPEQIHEGTVDRRADIYALGLIMWEMSVGQPLFSFEGPGQAMEADREQSLPNRSELRRCPPGWEGIIRRAISPEPRTRYTTALELQCDLEDVARSAGIGVSNLSIVRLLSELFPDSAPMKAAPMPKRKLTVLAVDDEEEIGNLVRRCLRRSYVVDTASGVKQARAMLAESPYDIIISDERMPDGRGAELLTYVAATSPETVRIMVTAFPEADLMLEVINQGHIHRFLAKPFNRDDLFEAVESATREVRGVAGRQQHSSFGASEDGESAPFTKARDEEHTVVEARHAVSKQQSFAGNESADLPWAHLFSDCREALAVPGKSLALVHASRVFNDTWRGGIVKALEELGIVVSYEHCADDRMVLLVSGGSRSLDFVEQSLVRVVSTVLGADVGFGLVLSRIKDPQRFIEVARGATQLAEARLQEAALRV